MHILEQAKEVKAKLFSCLGPSQKDYRDTLLKTLGVFFCFCFFALVLVFVE